jgi:hypothetical protein
MYAWIWRHLPFGLPGKISGSALLVVGAAALLWFVVFPWADPFIEETLLPWDDAQLEGDFVPGADPVDPANPGDPGVDPGSPDPTPTDPHAIPYDTEG